LVATRTGLMRDRNHPKTVISIHVRALLAAPIVIIAAYLRLCLLIPGSGATLEAWVFGHASRAASPHVLDFMVSECERYVREIRFHRNRQEETEDP
jgi:hypothetical protein